MDHIKQAFVRGFNKEASNNSGQGGWEDWEEPSTSYTMAGLMGPVPFGSMTYQGMNQEESQDVLPAVGSAMATGSTALLGGSYGGDLLAKQFEPGLAKQSPSWAESFSKASWNPKSWLDSFFPKSSRKMLKYTVPAAVGASVLAGLGSEALSRWDSGEDLRPDFMRE